MAGIVNAADVSKLFWQPQLEALTYQVLFGSPEDKQKSAFAIDCPTPDREVHLLILKRNKQ